MTVYLWDASNHDDPIRVRDGIDGYTHKVAEGHPYFYRDQEYKASLNNARNLGIPVLGGYFVNHPGTQNDQADWFVACLDEDTPWWRDYPYFILQIDAEKFDYMSRAPNLAEIQAFGDRLVQHHGVDPRRVIAYAPKWLYGDSLTGLTYRLWASDYGGNPVMHYRDAYPGDGSKRWVAYSGQVPMILQYGSNTTIGDQTTCDANAYRGSLEELFAELGGDDVTAEENWKYGIIGPGKDHPEETGTFLVYANQYAYDAAQAAQAALAGVNEILALLKQGGGQVPTGPVNLTPEAIDAVAEATADEIARDPERDGDDK